MSRRKQENLTHKVCNLCGIEKEASKFHRRGRVSLRWWCIDCEREARAGKSRWYAQNLQNRYNLDFGDYELLYKKQNGKCAICSSGENGYLGKKRLAVDHCHETGKIRGLLCSGCNNALGHFKDNPDLIKKALIYLDETQAPTYPR